MFVGPWSKIPRTISIFVNEVNLQVFVNTEIPARVTGITGRRQREANSLFRDVRQNAFVGVQSHLMNLASQGDKEKSCEFRRCGDEAGYVEGGSVSSDDVVMKWDTWKVAAAVTGGVVPNEFQILNWVEIILLIQTMCLCLR